MLPWRVCLETMYAPAFLKGCPRVGLCRDPAHVKRFVKKVFNKWVMAPEGPTKEVYSQAAALLRQVRALSETSARLQAVLSQGTFCC